MLFLQNGVPPNFRLHYGHS